jgi:hypothetical protein
MKSKTTLEPILIPFDKEQVEFDVSLNKVYQDRY